MKIATILDQIDLGSMALPEFQRGYVWNREQVRGLMHSLYRKHPVGSLLVWLTKTENANARGDGSLAPGVVKLLLDGQQRITSLFGIVRGKSPKFFDGDAGTFTGLHFNLDEEAFEFYAPGKMKDNPLWINVTKLMKVGSGEEIQRIVATPALQPKLTLRMDQLFLLDLQETRRGATSRSREPPRSPRSRVTLLRIPTSHPPRRPAARCPAGRGRGRSPS